MPIDIQATCIHIKTLIPTVLLTIAKAQKNTRLLPEVEVKLVLIICPQGKHGKHSQPNTFFY